MRIPSTVAVLLLLLGMSLVTMADAQRADSVVTINELHYHPRTGDGAEWVELHNQMEIRVDLSGWRLSAGVEFTFPEGSVIDPGAYWVIASDPSHPSLESLSRDLVHGPFVGRLDNGGEVVRLRGRYGRVMDELEFRDGGAWPVAPDGGGVSLAKRRPESASGDPSSWTWSTAPGGTPGGANFPDDPVDDQVTVIDGGTAWRFSPGGEGEGVAWRLPGYDDGEWQRGRGLFATGLVQNPSFEAETFTVLPGDISRNSAITAWQPYNDGVPGGQSLIGLNTFGSLDSFANNGRVPDGENVAFIRGGPRSLGQELRGLLVGQRYLLSYRENARSPTNPVGSAVLGGRELVPPHPVAAVDSLDRFAQPYHHQVGRVFPATAETSALRLLNHGGAADTILYDAVRLDPAILYHRGNGAEAVHRPLPELDDVVILRAELDPGPGSEGASFGFKRVDGNQSLQDEGVLWVDVDASGRLVLRADEAGGDQVVAFSNNAALAAGQLNRVALIWNRRSAGVSVVVNERTLFNELDLDARAGGSDGRFGPTVAALGLVFGSGGGTLEELAVATGRAAATILPGGTATVYRLRSEFAWNEQSAGDLLLAATSIGEARFFLNGIEVHRQLGSLENTVLLPGDALRVGTNSLAVELRPPDGESEVALEVGLTVVRRGNELQRPPLRLNEVAAGGEEDFFVEVRNTGGVPLRLADYTLNTFALPDEWLPGGEVRAYPATELGFAGVEGETVFLWDASGAVADAVRVTSRLQGHDPGRGRWQHPDRPTPGTANSFSYETRVVINEVLYHHRPDYADPAAGIDYSENGLEWIELCNRSTEALDIGGWSFRDAVRYEFPAGTILPPRGYLVVSNELFAGGFDNGGERIELRDANQNTVDELDYRDDAPWPKNADGRGSSLERVHPMADSRDPKSWAASNESLRSEWKTYRYRGRPVEPPGNNNPGYFHEFLMGMLEAGEILIDDLSVREDPDGASIELIQNGHFEADAVGASPRSWRILGTHSRSEVVALPEGGKALKLVASGGLEHSYNLASTTFANGRTTNAGRTYEISFRAKWLSGSPQLNTRLYFNRLSRTHILSQPATVGTPGGPNSTLLSGPPPAVTGLRHAPLVPAAGEPIRIEAVIGSADGLGRAVVHYNSGGEWEQVSMMGSEGGSHVAILPGQDRGAIVRFYVEAVSTSDIRTTAPAGGSAARALIRIGDRLSGPREGKTVRLIMLPEEAEFMHTAHHTPSGERIGATVIYNEREVWYDAGIRLRGSPYGRRGARVGWNVKFPATRPFRGVHETVAIDGGFSVPRGDGSGWIQVGAGVATNELVYNQMAHRAGGVPATHDDIIRVEAPRASDDKLAQLKMARFGDIWKSSSFPDGERGTSFKFELVYHPTGTLDGNPQSLKGPYNQVLGIDIRNMGADKEAYRHNFLIQNHTDRDDFGSVIAAGRAMSAPAGGLRAATDAALDVDNWLRVMAFQALTMTLDSYNNGLAHNMLLYERPSDGKVMWIPWDVDHAFYAAPTSSIYGIANADFAEVVQIPANRRAYFGHLLDLCSTGFHPAYVGEWVSHFNEVADMSAAAHYTQWISDRRNHVLNQLRLRHPPEPFRITSNGGQNFSTADPEAVLIGKGWIDVREIHLVSNGEPLAVYWIDDDDWRIVMPLQRGANAIQLVAYDHRGEEVGTDSIVVTNTGNLEPASSRNLVVSEIMYHPADPTAEERAEGFTNDGAFEYIELQNIGPARIDLGGVAFTEGILFTFSSGAITELAPGERVLLVRDESGFARRHGDGVPVAGVFEGDTALANNGERLRLVDTAGGTIRDFSYGDDFPWPAGADGGGYSLVLRDPASNPDHSLPQSWRHSTLPGGNPGATDVEIFSGDPDDDDDGDGLSNYLNFALGGGAPRLSREGGQVILTHTRNLAADGAAISLETSLDLREWTPAGLDPAGELPLGDGTSLVRWELGMDGPQRFLRLRVTGP